MGLRELKKTNFWDQVTKGIWSELAENMGNFQMVKYDEASKKYVADESGNRRRRQEWFHSGLSIESLRSWEASRLESEMIDNWNKEDNIFETTR